MSTVPVFSRAPYSDLLFPDVFQHHHALHQHVCRIATESGDPLYASTVEWKHHVLANPSLDVQKKEDGAAEGEEENKEEIYLGSRLALSKETVWTLEHSTSRTHKRRQEFLP